MLFDLPINDEDEELEVGVPSTGAYPELTAWQKKCSLGCCDLNYVPTGKQYFLNHWKIRPIPFSIVNFIIWSSYTVYILIHREILGHPTLIVCILTALAILFSFSYAMIIYEGPGYLPFYYPLQLAKRSSKNQDYLSGLVTTQMQEAYVKGRLHLNRCGYFSVVKRYVLRPDHFCGWTGSFIGKKNHKLFFLFNYWGMNYIIVFLIFSIMSLSSQFQDAHRNTFRLVVSLIYTILAVFFVAMTASFTFTSLYHFTVNITQFELMKRKVPPRIEPSKVLANFEEVFGPASKWYTWLLPIGAFHGIPEEELLENRSSMI